MFSFTVYDLLKSLIIAFLYVGVFRVQAKIDPQNYFGFGELLYGLRVSIKPLAFLIKALIIFVFSIFSFIIVKNDILVMLGIGVGSFLLVWPGILYNNVLDYKLRKRRKLVITVYVIFIILSVVISWFGIIVSVFIKPLTIEYVKSFNNASHLYTLLMDGFLFSIFYYIGFRVLNILNKDIKTK